MPKTTFTYLGSETVTKGILVLKIERVYERITKTITNESLDGTTLIQIDLGQPISLLTFEGWCTTRSEKNDIKKTLMEWFLGAGDDYAMEILVDYASLGGVDQMWGSVKSFTSTYDEGEKQWKYTIEIAEYIK